jgi:hypothetical protein
MIYILLVLNGHTQFAMIVVWGFAVIVSLSGSLITVGLWFVLGVSFQLELPRQLI